MGFINPGRDSYGRIRGIRRQSPWHDLRTQNSTPSNRPPKRSKRQHHHERPKPTLTRLPTELLQNIFLASLNPAFAVTTRALTQILSGRHLHLRYLHIHRHSPQDLTRIFSARFFTSQFLFDYESHFSLRLAADQTFLPLRLLAGRDVQLISMLTERGARWNPDEQDAVIEGLHDAFREGRTDTVEAVLMDPDVGVDTECLRLAVDADCREEILEALTERGAETGNLKLWKAALAKGGDVVEWLLARAVPPGEVLGDLAVR